MHAKPNSSNHPSRPLYGYGGNILRVDLSDRPPQGTARL